MSMFREDYNELFRNPKNMNRSYDFEIRKWITTNFKKLQKKYNVIDTPFIKNDFTCSSYRYSIEYKEENICKDRESSFFGLVNTSNDTVATHKIKLVDNNNNNIKIKLTLGDLIISNEKYFKQIDSSVELLECSACETMIRIEYNKESINLLLYGEDFADDFNSDLLDFLFELNKMYCIIKSN